MAKSIWVVTQYVTGRDVMTKPLTRTRALEIRKQWAHAIKTSGMFKKDKITFKVERAK
jgi:hypothetical protein